MASATGIELCPASCLLTGIRPLRGGDAEIFALRRLEGPYWPTQDELVVQSLETVRRDGRLPRRAFVVAWEFDDATPDRRSPHGVLRSIEAAGFQTASVLTPPEALQRLAVARQRTTSAATIAWLALNTCGAAIAIVRGRDLLFSRSFAWVYRDDLTTARAQALQRYTLVAHLALEINHGIDVVRREHGSQVESIVSCGDLPDLRSLTMPLIEELDLEVETLDSTDGLRVARNVTIDGFPESAPAIRLATAGTLVSADESVFHSLLPVLLRTAAVIAALAVAWIGYSYWSGAHAPPAVAQESSPQPIATQGRREPNRAPPSDSAASEQVAQQSERRSTDKSTVAAAPAPTQPPPAPLLRDPLPRIDTVLIDQDRRLALVDGGVVEIGDAIGSRVVVGIDRDSVALREPSGRTIKVRVRSSSDSQRHK
jgi:hypothetical protein